MAKDLGSVEADGTVRITAAAVKPILPRMYARLEPYLPLFGYQPS